MTLDMLPLIGYAAAASTVYQIVAEVVSSVLHKRRARGLRRM
jgi:hypothetical protein